MRRPHILVRFIGTPLVACVLLLSAAFVLFAGYLGQAPWWLVLTAALSPFRIVSAMRSVRRYKAWQAEWDAMEKGAKKPTALPKSRQWKFTAVMALAFLAFPASFAVPAVEASPALLNALHGIWLLLGLFALLRVLRCIRRLARKMLGRVGANRIETNVDTPVEIAVGRAGLSPSRADAERNLPEYCLRLMARN